MILAEIGDTIAMVIIFGPIFLILIFLGIGISGDSGDWPRRRP